MLTDERRDRYRDSHTKCPTIGCPLRPHREDTRIPSTEPQDTEPGFSAYGENISEEERATRVPLRAWGLTRGALLAVASSLTLMFLPSCQRTPEVGGHGSDLDKPASAPARPVSEIRTLRDHTHSAESVSFSPDGRTLASAGSEDHTINLWDVTSGRLVRSLRGHTKGVLAIAFSPDGRTLASASKDENIMLWDPASGRLMRTLEGGFLGQYNSIAFSADGRMLALGHVFTSNVRLLNVLSGQFGLEFVGGTNVLGSGSVFGVAVSPHGRVLASASTDRAINLWDLASGQKLRTLNGHTDAVTSVAYSPDGRTLASGSWDKTVKLWDVASGQLLRTLKGHTGGVISVSFSRDGRTVASGSKDHTIDLWAVASEQVLYTLQGHTDVVTQVAFSPDGKTLASGSSDKTIKLWDVSGLQK